MAGLESLRPLDVGHGKRWKLLGKNLDELTDDCDRSGSESTDSNFNELPDELVLLILDWLTTSELLQVQSVCIRFSELVQQHLKSLKVLRIPELPLRISTLNGVARLITDRCGRSLERIEFEQGDDEFSSHLFKFSEMSALAEKCPNLSFFSDWPFQAQMDYSEQLKGRNQIRTLILREDSFKRLCPNWFENVSSVWPRLERIYLHGDNPIEFLKANRIHTLHQLDLKSVNFGNLIDSDRRRQFVLALNNFARNGAISIDLTFKLMRSEDTFTDIMGAFNEVVAAVPAVHRLYIRMFEPDTNLGESVVEKVAALKISANLDLDQNYPQLKRMNSLEKLSLKLEGENELFNQIGADLFPKLTELKISGWFGNPTCKQLIRFLQIRGAKLKRLTVGTLCHLNQNQDELWSTIAEQCSQLRSLRITIAHFLLRTLTSESPNEAENVRIHVRRVRKRVPQRIRLIFRSQSDILIRAIKPLVKETDRAIRIEKDSIKLQLLAV